MLRPALFCLLAVFAAMPADAGGLVEPRLTLAPSLHQQPHVALTLDACSGAADSRILDALVQNRIPATVFVTARWLKRNPEALRQMLNHADLFQIENHGARHLPAVDHPASVYGIPAAGSPEAVKAEVSGGALAVTAATGQAPRWYRGATGKYSTSALALIVAEGEAVAGYSLIADDGASLPAPAVVHRLSKARDGDVIIAHVNHPEKPAGQGLVTGILALKAKGYVFVRLGSPHAGQLPSPHGS